MYIAKPTAGSQGRGVQLVKRWQDLKPIVREVWPEGIDKSDQRFVHFSSKFINMEASEIKKVEIKTRKDKFEKMEEGMNAVKLWKKMDEMLPSDRRRRSISWV